MRVKRRRVVRNESRRSLKKSQKILHFRLKLCMIYYDTYSRGVCPNGIIARRN